LVQDIIKAYEAYEKNGRKASHQGPNASPGTQR
jgi:hypothetical protein